MIILGIADIHIYNYGLYSDYDENGVPSRLKDFDLLADEINHQAEKEKADAIVFAGDLVHSASPAPMVLNYTAGFVRKVAEENPNRGFIVIVGQHDLDNKNDANNSVHSVVTPLVPSFENLFYVPDRQEIDLDGVNFFCKSWTTNQSDISDFPEADVFVGHGLVHTAKDPFGHVFDNGFSVPQLLSKYPVSIIGDIHNPHTWIKGGRGVFIPGQPLQSNFSSADPGMVVIDFDQKTRQIKSAKRIAFKDYVSSKSFHFFKYVDDERLKEKEESRYVHVRFKPLEKKRTKKEAQEVASLSEGINVMDIFGGKVIGTDYEPAYPIVETAYQKIKEKEIKAASPSTLLDIEIKNFISIEHLKIDFSKIAGMMAISGMNGTGKTTIPEAVYWLVTGETTKNLTKDEINFDFGRLPAYVKGRILVKEKTWVIERSTKAPVLMFYQDGKPDGATKTSAAQTQKLIYEVLGITQADILALMYYSIHESKTYSASSRAEKQDLLGRISGKEVVENLAEAFDKEVTALSEETSKLSGKLESSKQSIEVYKGRIERLAEEHRNSRNKRKRSDIQKEIDELDSQKVDMSDYISLSGEIQALENEAGKCLMRESTIESQIERAEREIAQAAEKMNAAKSGKCHACDQSLPDSKEHIEKHKAEIRASKERLAEAQESLAKVKIDFKSYSDAAEAKKSDLEKLEDKRAKNTAVEKQIRALKQEMSELPPDRDYAAEIRQIKELKAEAEESIEGLDEKLKDNQECLAACRQVKLKFLSRDSILTRELSKRAISLIEKEVNGLVQDPNLYKIEMNPEDPDDIKAKFAENTFPVSIRGMSGGQRRTTDVLIMLAQGNLCNRLYGLENGILGVTFLDEIFAYLDQRYVDLLMHCTENTSSRLTVVITQDAAIKNMIDQTLVVTKKAGVGSQYRFVNVEQ